MRWTTYLAAAAVAAVAEASSLTPPVIPLIVRNPYLSTWLGNARGLPWDRWPMFWTGQEVYKARPGCKTTPLNVLLGWIRCSCCSPEIRYSLPTTRQTSRLAAEVRR
jgi:hypothetical protein